MTSSLVDLTEGIPRHCITCDGPTCEVRAPIKRCSRCRTQYYCSVQCQKAHWREHKPYCIPLEQMSTAVDDLRSLQLDPSTFEEADTGATEDHECPICLSHPMDRPITLKACQHVFCTRCLVEWQKQRKDFPSGPSPCPLCRKDTEDIEQTLLERAHLLASEANMRDSLVESQRTELRNKAIEYTDQLLAIPNVHIQTYFTKVQLLLALGKGRAALQCLADMIEENRKRLDHPIVRMMAQQEQAEANGNFDESERLQHACMRMLEEHGPLPTVVGGHASLQIDICMFTSKAYELMEDWKSALRSCLNAMAEIVDPSVVTPVVTRKVVMSIAHCAYMAGDYKRSIDASDMALAMNRHYDEVHKYKALSLKALGRLDEAIETMNQAVLYETPWKPENTAAALEMYRELISERDAN